MKNVVISILSSIIITGWDFWEYDVPGDRFWVGFALAIVILVILASFEEWLRERRMKKFRAERFGQMVREMKNRP